MWKYENEAVFTFVEELVETTNTTDFAVARFDGNNLLLIGSFDLFYYHEVELLFENVFYIETYTKMISSPKIRFATINELANYNHVGIEVKEHLFAISSDCYEPNPIYFIGASNLKARNCLVYHYDRENLKIGEEVWT